MYKRLVIWRTGIPASPFVSAWKQFVSWNERFEHMP